MRSPVNLGTPASGRVGLAQLAGRAIASTDGVAGTAGPAGRWRTVGSQQAIPGVLAVEDGRGRVDIELHLIAAWPPQTSLQQLGARVREQLHSSAGVAGMSGRLGAVSVFFDDVLAETACS